METGNNDELVAMAEHFPYSVEELAKIKEEVQKIFDHDDLLLRKVSMMKRYYHYHFRHLGAIQIPELEGILDLTLPQTPVVYWNDFFKGDIFQMIRFDIMIFDDFLFNRHCITEEMGPGGGIDGSIYKAFLFEAGDFNPSFNNELKVIDKLLIPLIGVLIMRLNFHFLEFYDYQPAFSKIEWADRLNSMFAIESNPMGHLYNFDTNNYMFNQANVSRIKRLCAEIKADKTSNLYLYFKDFNEQVYLHNVIDPTSDFYCNPEVIVYAMTINIYVNVAIDKYDEVPVTEEITWKTDTVVDQDFVKQWLTEGDRRLSQVSSVQQEVENLL